jgi:hypothetical protein
MNYLALVNALKEKCGVSGDDLLTVTGQTGEYRKLCNFINDAWMDIQLTHRKWQYMRGDFSFAVTAGTRSYSATAAGLTDFANWDEDTFRVYQTSLSFNNEIWMWKWPYEQFRNLYLFGNMRNNTARPVVYTIDPQKNILLGPIPNISDYTINGKYFKVPTELVASTDIPGMPVEYHRAIVYRAMMRYAASESAGEVYQEGKSESDKILGRLEVDQMPDLNLGEPML